MHRGVQPKTVKHGRTPNADWTDVLDEPYTGPSPDLPKLAGRRKWTELTLQWWEQVRVMPHCVLWQAGDWQFAVETAMLKDQFWRELAEGEMKATTATEIRRREGLMGTTMEARRQLRIRYVPVGGEVDDVPPERPMVVQEEEETMQDSGAVATVTPIADRRARLTRAN